MSLWTTPADPNLDIFPGLTDEQVKEALSKIDAEKILEDMENGQSFKSD